MRARLELANPPGELLQHEDGDLGLALEHLQEGRGAEAEAPHLRPRHHGRRTLRPVDERDLAEVVTRAERQRGEPAGPQHRGGAFEHDEEAVAALAEPHDGTSGREADLLGQRRDLPHLALRDPREERHASEDASPELAGVRQRGARERLAERQGSRTRQRFLLLSEAGHYTLAGASRAERTQPGWRQRGGRGKLAAMVRRGSRARRWRAALLVGAAASAACGDGETRVDPAAIARARARGSSAAHEWRHYLGDPAMSHFSPLTEIDRSNVARLEVAWRYDAGEASAVGGSQIQFNPLVVKGILYGSSPSLRLFALDASTGEELWSFQPDGEVMGWTMTRGACYWEEGAEERLLYGAGPYLYALDPGTGRRLHDFGQNGRVDLRDDLGRDVSDDDDVGVALTSPPALFADLAIVGSRVNEGEGAAPGHIRAYDVRSGALRWTFHTIPRPGEAGHETWPADAWRSAGGANAWAGLSVDRARGLAFAPTGSATPDFVGASRLGDNLFANSLLALDARSGRLRWHFQVMRHDLWDRDLPAPPNLVEIERAGEQVPAVAQVTKTGDTFVFHRESGKPLFPIREEPGVATTVPGDRAAASQPVPERPPSFAPQGFDDSRVTDHSPEAARHVRERIAGMRQDAHAPPSTEGTVLYPGINGGAQWGGAAWDGAAGLLIVNANHVPSILRLVEVEADPDLFERFAQGYVAACGGCHGTDLRGDGSSVPSLRGVGRRLGPLGVYRVIRDGRGRMPAQGGLAKWWQIAWLAAFVSIVGESDASLQLAPEANKPTIFAHAGYQNLVDPQGLPGSKPPWGTLAALDLSAGEIRWQVPLGDYPQILAAGQRGLGAENYGGPIATAGGVVFVAATPDAQLRAFDTRTGELLFETKLPAAGFATPATYEAGGRQLVVVAAGGGKLGQPSGSEYVAFALPR